MTRRGKHRRKSTPQRVDGAQVQPGASRREEKRASLLEMFLSSSPFQWYSAALLPIGIGFFMYAMEVDGAGDGLRDPVPTMGEFISAECVEPRTGSSRPFMRLTYAFKVPGFTEAVQGNEMPRLAENFTVSRHISYYRGWCEGALPAVLEAKAPHQVWYERDQPHSAATTLEEPDSTRFFRIWLGAIPLFGIGWWLGRRRRAMAAT